MSVGFCDSILRGPLSLSPSLSLTMVSFLAQLRVHISSGGVKIEIQTDNEFLEDRVIH